MVNNYNEWEGLTLASVLDLDGDVDINIKLGTVDGCAFIYCGPFKKLKDDIQDIDINYDREYKEKVVSAESRFEKTAKEAAAPGDYIYGRYKRTNGVSVGTVVGYFEYLQKHIEKCERLRDSLKSLKSHKYVSLYDRKIMEIRSSIDEVATLIVLIEGSELGQYWTTNEYQNGVSKEDAEETMEDGLDNN